MSDKVHALTRVFFGEMTTVDSCGSGDVHGCWAGALLEQAYPSKFSRSLVQRLLLLYQLMILFLHQTELQASIAFWWGLKNPRTIFPGLNARIPSPPFPYTPVPASWIFVSRST